MTSRNKAIVKAQALLDEFLSGYRKSTGGYAEVTEQDENKLYELLQVILEAKFQRDPDGDFPIEISVTNRHKHERDQFLSQPYSHKAQTFEELLDVVAVAQTNVSIANSTLDREFKHLMYMKQKLTKKEK